MDTTVLYLPFVILSGAILGSVGTMFIHRLVSGQPLLWGSSTGWARSQCPHCRTQLRWFELVPVLSWLGLRGRCSHCQHFIGWRYPIIELLTIAVWVIAYQLQPDFTLVTVLEASVATLLLWIGITDILTGLIPDRLTIPTLLLSIPTSLLLGHLWWLVLSGAAIGGLWFGLQYVGSHGRWVGGGDLRLGLVMGTLLGFPLILYAFLIAYVSGGIVATFFLLTKRLHRHDRLPFAPFLVLGTLIMLLWGDTLIWYNSLLGIAYLFR